MNATFPAIGYLWIGGSFILMISSLLMPHFHFRPKWASRHWVLDTFLVVTGLLFAYAYTLMESEFHYSNHYLSLAVYLIIVIHPLVAFIALARKLHVHSECKFTQTVIQRIFLAVDSAPLTLITLVGASILIGIQSISAVGSPAVNIVAMILALLTSGLVIFLGWRINQSREAGRGILVFICAMTVYALAALIRLFSAELTRAAGLPPPLGGLPFHVREYDVLVMALVLTSCLVLVLNNLLIGFRLAWTLKFLRIERSTKRFGLMRDARRQMDFYVSSSPAMVFFLEQINGKFVRKYFSKNIHRILGYSVEQTLQFEWWSKNVHPEDLIEQRITGRDIANLYTAGGTTTAVYRFRHANGTWCWIHEELRLIQSVQGGAKKIFGVWTEATQLYRQGLDSSKRERERILGQLAAGVAHDFNNILTIIVSAIDALDAVEPAAVGSNEWKGLLEVAMDAALRGTSITETLSGFRVSTDATHERIDLVAHLKSTFRLIQQAAGPYVQVNLLIDGAPIAEQTKHESRPGKTAAYYIHVDVPELDRSIVNLAANARDAMSSTGGELTISLEGAAGAVSEEHQGSGMAGHRVELTFADNGPGMSDFVREHALEPYFTTKGDNGTGLGLPMVNAFSVRFGGRMSIESSAGSGTRIKITLPCDESPPSADVDDGVAGGRAADIGLDKVPEAAPTDNSVWSVGERTVRPDQLAQAQTIDDSNVESASELKGVRVLVVDDEIHVAKLIERVLSNNGALVVTAKGATIGMDVMREQSFDLLITDIAMPGEIDGVKLARWAKDNHRAKEILLMSGFSRSHARDKVDWPILKKPFRANQLMTTVLSMVGSDLRA